MRIALLDDVMVMRAGLRLLLEQSGIEVAWEAASAGEAIALVRKDTPDVAIFDVRLVRQGSGLEGLEAAEAVRAEHPDVAILLHTENPANVPRARFEALGTGIGLMTKASVAAAGVLVETLEQLAVRDRTGRFVHSYVDPWVWGQMWRASGSRFADRLTPRERETVALLCEGYNNRRIAKAMHISEGMVDKNLANIFSKLEEIGDNMRIIAVRKWIEEGGSDASGPSLSA
jgi:DNA-binding NarL/FixJ family response regulator